MLHSHQHYAKNSSYRYCRAKHQCHWRTYTPFIKKYLEEHHLTHIEPPFPPFTTTAQSCYVTGKNADTHGIVGNGWYDRDESEVKFWKQSNKLVKAEKIWELANRIKIYVFHGFWWYNMYSSADFSVTPRPQHRVMV